MIVRMARCMGLPPVFAFTLLSAAAFAAQKKLCCGVACRPEGERVFNGAAISNWMKCRNKGRKFDAPRQSCPYRYARLRCDRFGRRAAGVHPRPDPLLELRRRHR